MSPLTPLQLCEIKKSWNSELAKDQTALIKQLIFLPSPLLPSKNKLKLFPFQNLYTYTSNYSTHV